jgi:ABC-type molybdate transport system permease subunit
VAVHIIVSVGLLGADASVLLLCIAGARGSDPRTVYPAAHLIAGTLLVPLVVLAFATGLALGLLTPWGIVLYWWVTIKLAFTAAGIVLALLILVPTLSAAAGASTAVARAPLPFADRLGLVKDASSASTVLILTVLLAVYKPFGRLRGRRPGPPERRRGFSPR